MRYKSLIMIVVIISIISCNNNSAIILSDHNNEIKKNKALSVINNIDYITYLDSLAKCTSRMNQLDINIKSFYWKKIESLNLGEDMVFVKIFDENS